jgi:hypothetical protein
MGGDEPGHGVGSGEIRGELSEPFGLAFALHPLRLPEIAINVFWHAKAHGSLPNQWLRSVVFELFAGKGRGVASITA